MGTPVADILLSCCWADKGSILAGWFWNLCFTSVCLSFILYVVSVFIILLFLQRVISFCLFLSFFFFFLWWLCAGDGNRPNLWGEFTESYTHDPPVGGWVHPGPPEWQRICWWLRYQQQPACTKVHTCAYNCQGLFMTGRSGIVKKKKFFVAIPLSMLTSEALFPCCLFRQSYTQTVNETTHQ